MKVKDKFYPGWKLTPAQHGAYWKFIAQVCARVGARTAAEREDARKQVHLAAFGCEKSAREINHLRDFDDFKAACLAILSPENLGAQLRQAEMPHTRLVHAIRALAPEAYVIAIARAKFHTDDWEGLDESRLTMLRNTLAARAAEVRWPETVRSPESRVQSPESRVQSLEVAA